MIDVPTPYNQYAEEFILASTFLDDRVVGDLISSGVSEDTFHESIHQDVWRIVKQYYAEGTVFDEVGVAQELNDRYDYAEPMAVVNQISKAAETTTSTSIYVKVCIDTERRRKLLKAAIECVDSVRKESDPDEIQEKLAQTLQESGQDILSDADIPTETSKVIDDIRERNSKQTKFVGISTGFPLLDYYLSGYRPESLNILAGRPGAGKCLGGETKVVMFDGTLRKARDVKEGEFLMGPDSLPRQVLGTTCGYGQMYEIQQNKGMNYMVNDVHVLSLKASGTEGSRKHGEIVNIPVNEYLKKSEKFQIKHKGWATGWELPHQIQPIPSYLLGVWLGDGTASKSDITNSDPEVIYYCEEYARRENYQFCTVRDRNTYTIKITDKQRRSNSLQAKLRRLDVLGNKHIPDVYLRGSRYQRLELLAGLLDTDGHNVDDRYYEITQKSRTLIEQIKYLANSLGYRTTLTPKKGTIKSLDFTGDYWRLTIYGAIDEIPLKVERKTIKNKKTGDKPTGIKVQDVGYGYYYGFELSGDHLFLLEDGTVTHNTSMALQIALNILHQQIPVRIWSLEMSAQQLLAKLIANLSEVDPNRSKDGLITQAEFELMEQARYRLSHLPLCISDASHVTVERIAAQHRRDLAKHGQCMVVIDYLQLIRSTDRKLSREQQISSMSRDLKCLFKDTQTQGIVLSQLNRNSDQSAEPKLSDLRESGAIEQDADTVMFIYGEGQVKLGKNRHGAEGKLTMNFNKPISKFTKQ